MAKNSELHFKTSKCHFAQISEIIRFYIKKMVIFNECWVFFIFSLTTTYFKSFAESMLQFKVGRPKRLFRASILMLDRRD
jgi:hypothetical protein